MSLLLGRVIGFAWSNQPFLFQCEAEVAMVAALHARLRVLRHYRVVGVVSNISTLGGKMVQCRADLAHTCRVGLIQFGSSNVPTVIPRMPGIHSAVFATVVPQRGQNSNLTQRLLSSERYS